MSLRFSEGRGGGEREREREIGREGEREHRAAELRQPGQQSICFLKSKLEHLSSGGWGRGEVGTSYINHRVSGTPPGGRQCSPLSQALSLLLVFSWTHLGSLHDSWTWYQDLQEGMAIGGWGEWKAS